MEAVGAAASLLAIAGAGIQISLKLIAFADQVGTAPQRIRDVGTDVSVTAGTLQELGELMKKTSTKKSAGMFNPDQIQNIVTFSTRCKEIFDELKFILSKASQQLRNVYKSTAKSHDTSSKIRLSRLERLKWPFLQPSLKPLLGTLRDAKGTLTLILQVAHLWHAQKIASPGWEEQSDLIRMIAAMKRQNLVSANGDEGGYKDLDFGADTEDSDFNDSLEVPTVVEAWSVTPNIFSDDAFQHFLITPIPISKQQVAKLLKNSPQDFGEIASMIDSLSVPEKDAIFGRLLDMRNPHSVESTIRSISSHSWEGSHDLFGRVTGRKFNLIIERQVRASKSSRGYMRSRPARVVHESHRYHPDPDPLVYDSFSDNDGIQTHTSPPPAPDMPSSSERREHAYQAPTFENRGPRKRKEEIKEKKCVEQKRFHKGKKESSQPRTEPHCRYPVNPDQANESSDDDLVKSLLVQYTNFGPEEPLVQVSTTPPPSYDESFAIPKRVPRPY